MSMEITNNYSDYGKGYTNTAKDDGMSNITNYSYLIQSMFGTKSNAGVVNPLKVSDLSNGSLRSQLKAAGIDTNSAQYYKRVKLYIGSDNANAYSYG